MKTLKEKLKRCITLNRTRGYVYDVLTDRDKANLLNSGYKEYNENKNLYDSIDFFPISPKVKNRLIDIGLDKLLSDISIELKIHSSDPIYIDRTAVLQ